MHGAIALGREVRKLKLATTVGTLVDLPADSEEQPRVTFSPQADCESMCAFVLLGGVRRTVPAESRVMVHQIWLGDRREDPTAAGYSAEDLVLVQRDIGRLARYTADMGASADLLEVALRIPPWEPMHALTRDELRLTKLTTEDVDAPVTARPSPQLAGVGAAARPRATKGLQAVPPATSDGRWWIEPVRLRSPAAIRLLWKARRSEALILSWLVVRVLTATTSATSSVGIAGSRHRFPPQLTRSACASAAIQRC